MVRPHDLLLSVAPARTAALARAVAVAVAERDGPRPAGGAERSGDDVRVRGVRSELLARAGRWGEAVEEAVPRDGDVLTAPERRFLERRVRQWRALAGAEAPGQPPRMSARS